MDETLTDTLVIAELLTNEVTDFKPMYGSVVGANRYWSEQLSGQKWSTYTLDLKQRALITATKILDDLNFAGSKTDEDQPLEWPRFDQTDVPQAIQEASYELAFALVKGIDPQKEYDEAFVKLRYFGKIRVDYEHGGLVPEYLVAGIPSLVTWNKLKPYLSRDISLKLRRES